MAELPPSLRLEVKTSRSGRVALSARDLAAVGPDGAVCVLLGGGTLRAPRWAVVPARLLAPGSRGEEELARLAEEGPLAAGLNRRWADWLLDAKALELLFAAGVKAVRERVRWCRKPGQPREDRSPGVVREIRLTRALEALRSRLDELARDNAPQLEGQVHQALLEDALESMGYAVVENPVGVPDITATRRG